MWRHTRRGDKFVTVFTDLTGIHDGTGPARSLDMVEGRSKQVSNSCLAECFQVWRDGVEVVAMDGFPASRSTLPRNSATPSRSWIPSTSSAWPTTHSTSAGAGSADHPRPPRDEEGPALLHQADAAHRRGLLTDKQQAHGGPCQVARARRDQQGEGGGNEAGDAPGRPAFLARVSMGAVGQSWRWRRALITAAMAGSSARSRWWAAMRSTCHSGMSLTSSSTRLREKLFVEEVRTAAPEVHGEGVTAQPGGVAAACRERVVRVADRDDRLTAELVQPYLGSVRQRQRDGDVGRACGHSLQGAGAVLVIDDDGVLEWLEGADDEGNGQRPGWPGSRLCVQPDSPRSGSFPRNGRGEHRAG